MQKGEEQATYKSDLCPFNLRSKKSFNLRATEEPARQGEFRKAEDNRIFLSTSLTMPPTRFPNSPPPPPGMAGQGTADVQRALVVGHMLFKSNPGLPSHKGLQSQAHQLSATHRKAFETVLLQQRKMFHCSDFCCADSNLNTGNIVCNGLMCQLSSGPGKEWIWEQQPG